MKKKYVIGLDYGTQSARAVLVDVSNGEIKARSSREYPHAYVKLWKHHAAQPEAAHMTEIAVERQETFLNRYGGKISSEWLQPKVMQILNEAPHVYEAAWRFMEAGDWANLMLTGQERPSSCFAGYKELWHKKDGDPSPEFFKSVDPRMEHFTEEKLNRNIRPLGEKAGELTGEWAERTGLREGTAVGVSIIDAHAGVPGIGITKTGQMLMIMGTSTCHILLDEEEKEVPGMCGVVEDGIYPGLFAYEAGQACVGDHFDWFVKNLAGSACEREAGERGISIHQLLTEKAEKLKPGESGLLALDWWNGNRTPLVDYDLSGLILGMSLNTRPEEIYRALIEATAYGTNWIIETYEKAGISISELFACGGIAEKNSMMMQIYADVTNREIFVSASDQTPALGAAMFGAVAAGGKAGGYDTIYEAAKAMGRVKDQSYKPIPEHARQYARLYQDYKQLAEYFGSTENQMMKRLKHMRAQAGKAEEEGGYLCQEKRLIGSNPVIGIRPIIDARQGILDVRGSLEEQTMRMAQSAKKLLEEQVRCSDGTPVQVVIADTTIGRVAEAAACAEKFKRAGVDIALSVTPCWCYGSETMDMDPMTIKGVWGLNATERPGAVYLASVLAAHARKGLPAFGIYGRDVQEKDDEKIPDDVKEKLIRFGRAAVAAATMRGKSYLQIGATCMGISGSSIDPDFFEEYLGMRIESVDEVEVLRRIEQEIYDKEEYEKALEWTKKNTAEKGLTRIRSLRKSPERPRMKPGSSPSNVLSSSRI